MGKTVEDNLEQNGSSYKCLVLHLASYTGLPHFLPQCAEKGRNIKSEYNHIRLKDTEVNIQLKKE